jgi:hypothetical protein
VWVYSLVIAQGTSHFDVVDSNPHQLVGLIVMILTAMQPILGFVADRMFVANRFEVPVFPDRVHWWLGRLIIVAAFVNIYLGFKLFPGKARSRLIGVRMSACVRW